MIRCSLFCFLFHDLISYVISDNQLTSIFIQPVKYYVFFTCYGLLCTVLADSQFAVDFIDAFTQPSVRSRLRICLHLGVSV